MEKFGKEYYERIWGTVHRHDYCSGYIIQIISQCNPRRVLDIGTGCGYTVKMLREKGIEAWGLECSDYAINNSCAPGYVVKGSVTDIPFKDGYFDAVVSNGLWEYIDKKDIPQANEEIHRVGRSHFHNIDHSGCTFDKDDPTPTEFLTIESMEWWNKQLESPKVLIACPTHDSKEYAHERWIEAIRQQNYPNFDILLIDNSDTTDCYNRWKDKVPMEHIDVPPEWEICQRMAVSMERLRKVFLEGNYKWWFNVEIDVILSSEVLDMLVRYSRDSDWFAHNYPARGDTSVDPDQTQSGIGCSLFSRRIMENFTFLGWENFCPDDALWRWTRPQNKYKVAELWGYTRPKHIGS